MNSSTQKPNKYEKLQEWIFIQVGIATHLLQFTLDEARRAELEEEIKIGLAWLTGSNYMKQRAAEAKEKSKKARENVFVIPTLYLVVAIPATCVYWAIVEGVLHEGWNATKTFASARMQNLRSLCGVKAQDTNNQNLDIPFAEVINANLNPIDIEMATVYPENHTTTNIDSKIPSAPPLAEQAQGVYFTGNTSLKPKLSHLKNDMNRYSFSTSSTTSSQSTRSSPVASSNVS